MRSLFLTAFVFIFNLTVFAQKTKESNSERPQNAVYIGVGGDASILSINYDRLNQVNSNFFLSTKVGLGMNIEPNLCLFGICSSKEEVYLTIPHHVTANWGKGKHFFEFGIGGTLNGAVVDQTYIMYPIFGYRLSPTKAKKFHFRAFVQFPFSSAKNLDLLFSPAGLSLGKSF